MLPGNLPTHPQPCQDKESRIQPEFPRQQKAQPAHGRRCNPVACVRARPLTQPWGSPCRLSGCLRPPVTVPSGLQSLWYQLRGCVVPGRPGSSKCHTMQPATDGPVVPLVPLLQLIHLQQDTRALGNLGERKGGRRDGKG